MRTSLYFTSRLLQSQDIILKCNAIVNKSDKNEFETFDVSNELCLLLYSHITMLALLFVDQAFVIFFLTSSEQIFRFRITSKQKLLLMLLKKKMTERSLFQRCKNIVRNVQIFEKKAFAYIILDSQINTLESVTDMKLFTSSYIFRRDNEQAFNNSSKQL